MSGRCYGVGVGPGDPELITVKAQRVLGSSPVVAYFSAVGRRSNARTVVNDLITSDHEELHMVYPVTTEPVPADTYEDLLVDFYDTSADQLASRLAAGRDVAVLCEGDPFFHGSFMYLNNRLRPRFPVEVVPGVPSILAGSAVIGAPLVCRDDVLCVLAGTLPFDELEERLASADAAVVMKVGRNLEKVKQAVDKAGMLDRAWYVERATMAGEKVVPLDEADLSGAPYFSMVVIPSRVASLR